MHLLHRIPFKHSEVCGCNTTKSEKSFILETLTVKEEQLRIKNVLLIDHYWVNVFLFLWHLVNLQKSSCKMKSTAEFYSNVKNDQNFRSSNCYSRTPTVYWWNKYWLNNKKKKRKEHSLMSDLRFKYINIASRQTSGTLYIFVESTRLIRSSMKPWSPGF